VAKKLKPARTCLDCGKALSPERHRSTKYCNASCRSRGRASRVGQFPCVICRRPTTQTKLGRGGSNSATCSSRCKTLSVKLTRGVRQCEWCSTPFWKSKHDQSLCSARCNALQRANTLVENNCSECGDAWMQPLMANQKGYTRCEKCSYSKAQRRSRTRNKRVNSRGFTKADVLREHGTDCTICHEPIDLDLKHPDPWCLSLDHAVPISKGGSEELSNVKPSHLRCNMRKGNNAYVTPAYARRASSGHKQKKRYGARPDPRPCQWCETIFQPNQGPHRYCSAQCRENDNRVCTCGRHRNKGQRLCHHCNWFSQIKKVQKVKPARVIHCNRCKEPFKPKGPTSAYCSNICRFGLKPCSRNCGASFTPTRDSKMKSRCDHCATITDDKFSTKPCANCGTELTVTARQHDFCSRSCSGRYNLRYHPPHGNGGPPDIAPSGSPTPRATHV